MTPQISLDTWFHLAQTLAVKADEILLSRFLHIKSERKADGSMVTEADYAMQKEVAEYLKIHYPQIDFIGEEMSEAEQLARLNHGKSPLWILDPLDGTGNFANGIPIFSVSLALINQGQIKAGLVYDPIRQELFYALRDQGAYLNDQRLDLSQNEVCQQKVELEKTTAIIDFKRLRKPLKLKIMDKMPFASQRSYGSVAIDWAWLAAGRGHTYLHGRQKIWDYAAGWLILKEAGGYSANLKGEPVPNFNQLHQSAVAAVNATLFEKWQTWIQKAQ